jgi:hypothetical protein
VTVYVAAPYRVDASTLPDAGVKPELLYAGRVSGETYPQLAAPTSFLTAYSATYRDPSRITDDFAFTQAASDDEFQRVRYVTKNDGLLTTLAIVLGGPLLVAIAALVIHRRRAIRQQSGPGIV